MARSFQVYIELSILLLTLNFLEVSYTGMFKIFQPVEDMPVANITRSIDKSVNNSAIEERSLPDFHKINPELMKFGKLQN